MKKFSIKKLNTAELEHKIAEVLHEITRTPEGRYFQRLTAVLQVLKGVDSKEIAGLYGVSYMLV